MHRKQVAQPKSSQSIYFAVKINKIIQSHYNYQLYSRKLQNHLTVS